MRIATMIPITTKIFLFVNILSTVHSLDTKRAATVATDKNATLPVTDGTSEKAMSAPESFSCCDQQHTKIWLALKKGAENFFWLIQRERSCCYYL